MSLFPDWQSRERFIRYIVARYAPMNVTWQGSGGIRGLSERPCAAEGTGTGSHEARSVSASALVECENHLVAAAGRRLDEFRHRGDHGRRDRLGGTSVLSGSVRRRHRCAASLERDHGRRVSGISRRPPILCRYWFDFISDTRHWELEPYFDVDGTRAVALEDVEYVNYIEHPGPPVEVSVEKHGYDVQWFNPATGEYLEQKKYRGEHFTGEAPDKSHPWVLLVAREGRKESMLKSYKFDSREVPLVQEIETKRQKVPFTIVEPTGNTIEAGKPVRFAVKLTRETRATRSMMYLWTAEVAVDGQGFRVIGTGAPGTFVIPPSVAKNFPAVLSHPLDRAQRERQGVRRGSSVRTDQVILSVDTTSEFGSIALTEGDRVIEEVLLHSPDGFGHVLFQHLEQFCRATARLWM